MLTKQLIKFLLFSAIIMFFSFSFANAASYTMDAKNTYTLSAPFVEGEEEVTGIANYMQSFFPFVLSMLSALALIMLVYGGIEYAMSAGNPSSMQNAKDRITSAIFGLLLAVGSYLLLYTINPNLVRLTINVTQITSSTGGTTGGTPSASPKIRNGQLGCSKSQDCLSGLCGSQISAAAASSDKTRCFRSNLISNKICAYNEQCLSGSCVKKPSKPKSRCN